MSDAPIPPVHKKGHGCFFYGCITCIVIAALAVGGIAFGVWKLKQVAMSMTDTQPIPIEIVTVSPEQLSEYEAKINAFSATVLAGKDPARLELNAFEINALINNKEDLKSLKGCVQVRLDNDQLGGKISIPLGRFSPPMAGRYLNGDGSFILSCQNGIPLLQLQSLSVRGKPVSDAFLKGMKEVNLAADLAENPENAKVLQRIKSIRIQGGKLIVETTPAQEVSEPALESTPTAPSP